MNHKRMKRILIAICAVFLVTGIILYTVFYLFLSENGADVLNAAMLGLFSLATMLIAIHSDEVLQWTTNNEWLHILFWACHLAALVLAQIAILSVFGRKLLDGFRIRFGRYKNVYIVKGCDKRSFVLGENIATGDNPTKKPKKDRLVVFLIDEDDDEYSIRKKAAHFNGIVRVIDRNHILEYHLKKIIRRKLMWIPSFLRKKTEYNIFLMPGDNAMPENVKKIVDLPDKPNKRGECRVNRKWRENVNIYTITEHEWFREEIIEIAQAIKEEGSAKRKYIYTFHIISEHDLRIRNVINEHPPVNCPGPGFICENYDVSGKAERPFTLLLVGFGSIGRRALLRFMMNSQFLMKDPANSVPIRVFIVDEEANDKLHCFKNDLPELDNCCEVIPAEDMKVPCEKFSDCMKNWGKDIDYVVVALSSDEKDWEVARYIKHSYEMGNSKGNPMPYIAVYEENGMPHMFNKDEKIFSFGCIEEIYTEKIIVNEEIDNMAITVNGTYRGIDPKDKEAKKRSWHEISRFHQESSRASADFINSMLVLSNLSIEQAEKMNSLTVDENLIEALGKTEHLRWNAFHVAMGYKQMSIEDMISRFNEPEQKNEKNLKSRLEYARHDTKGKQHVCLATWDELDNVSNAYKTLAGVFCGDDEDLKAKYKTDLERDFKKSDKDIVVNIPRILKSAKENYCTNPYCSDLIKKPGENHRYF